MLHDACCLWLHLRPRLEEAFPGSVVDKHLQMFWDGTLAVPTRQAPALGFFHGKILSSEFQGIFPGSVVDKHLQMFWDGTLAVPTRQATTLGFFRGKKYASEFQGISEEPVTNVQKHFSTEKSSKSKLPRKGIIVQNEFPGSNCDGFSEEPVTKS